MMNSTKVGTKGNASLSGKTDEDGSFSIHLKADEVEGVSEEDRLEFRMRVAYAETYPETAPEVEFREATNVSDKDVESLLRELEQMISDCLGMAMIFNLASYAKDWLDLKTSEILEEFRLSEERRIRREEEEEAKKYQGTRVTVESFMIWKAKFDEEMLSLQKQKSKRDMQKKPTGRELFEGDHTLVTSDAACLEEGDVEVDLELFEQELDNLSLDEDFEGDDITQLILGSAE